MIRSAYASPVQIAEVRLLRNGDKPNLRPGIKWWLQKSGARAFWDWPPQGTAVLDDEYPADGVADCHSSEIVDFTSRMDAKGRLHWDPPKGRWTILRFGYTLLGQKIRNTYTEQFAGYEADMLSSAGIESHFKGLVEPLLKIAPECVRPVAQGAAHRQLRDRRRRGRIAAHLVPYLSGGVPPAARLRRAPLPAGAGR